ncbi:SubName: Full=Uncharacterized protein {ECO:0000313/EMBL:CCA76767.1} [Serendipita indica DSM 11827]|nr:SubName: Full=Uncharacterized protein {ECO:0000313/EMBL:CCA76767.1} [Serendipita indica DSM 11827]
METSVPWLHYSRSESNVDTLGQTDTSRALSYPDTHLFPSALSVGKAIFVVAMDNTAAKRQIFREFIDNSGSSILPMSPAPSPCSSLGSSVNSLPDSDRISTQNPQIISGYSGSQYNGCATALDQMADDPMATSIYGEEGLAQLFQGPNPSAVDEMADALMAARTRAKEELAEAISNLCSPPPWLFNRVSPQPPSLDGAVGATPELIQLQKSIQGQAWLHANEPEPRDEAGNSIFGNFLVHNEATSEYTCRFDGCVKAYSRCDRAIGHIRSHFQHRPFICGGSCGVEMCKERFYCKSYLAAHVKRPKVDCDYWYVA